VREHCPAPRLWWGGVFTQLRHCAKHSEPRPNQLANGKDHDTSNEEQKDRDG
jgi:hypothetical protein